MSEHRSYFWDYVKSIFFILILLQIAPPLIENIKKQYGRIISPRPQVAVINISGTICDSAPYTKQLHKYFKDTDIKAIVLKIESPGSAAGTGQVLFNEIQLLKKDYHKPIITLVENICTSGGYYIASATDYIIASSNATVGSIGTLLPNFQLKEFIEQFKIHYDPIKSGAYKTATDPFTAQTPEEKALLQGLTNDVYEQFIEDVAKSRRLPIASHKEWADGKIFTGRQAVKIGLIDQTGSAQNAEHIIREKALIEGEIDWVSEPKLGTLAGFFGGQDTDDCSLIHSRVNQICAAIESRYSR